jgi:hypothetical protein
MLVAFTAGGLGSAGSAPADIPPGALAVTTTQTGTRAAQAADGNVPEGLSVTQGRHKGELIVTWRLPTSPDVVATVIYAGSGSARARAVVTYGGGRQVSPTATLHGLAAGRRVCLSAAHVVSAGDEVTDAVSRPVCAVPR